MAARPVIIRIQADVTGNYSLSITIGTDEDAQILYNGEIYLFADTEVAMDVSDFLREPVVTKREFTITIASISDEPLEEGSSSNLFVYPGACASDEVMDSKIQYLKTTPQNWLLSSRSMSAEICIPETELTDDIFKTRHVVNTFEPGETLLVRDEIGNTLFNFAFDGAFSIVNLRKSLFINTGILLSSFYFCYEFYDSIRKEKNSKIDFCIHITEAPFFEEQYFIDFINQFGISERIQLHSLIYAPIFEDRVEYLRYNKTSAKLLKKYERLPRRDVLAASIGHADNDRLAFVMDMFQGDIQKLITPTGEYSVKVTPDSSPIADSQRKLYEITMKIEFSETSDFSIFQKHNYNSRIFTSQFTTQFS